MKKSVPGTASTEAIKIGALVCQTGPCAEWGENSYNGIKLAMAEVNAAGGVHGRKLEMVNQDSAESKPANTINGYRSLTTMGVKFIIGPNWSPAGVALAPVASQDKGRTIVISPSLGVAQFNESSTNLFNVWPHDDIATRALARYAVQHGDKTVAIYGSKDAWYDEQATAFGDEFTKAGGKVLLREDQIPSEKDVRGVATKIKSAKPDAVFYAHYDNMGIMTKELKNQGYKGKQYSVLIDDSRLASAQGALEGAIYARYNPAVSGFQDNYKKMFNKEAGTTADTAYDAVNLFVKALRDAGTDDVTKVNAVMASYTTFDGASGKLTFDGKRGVARPPAFWHVKDGKFQQI